MIDQQALLRVLSYVHCFYIYKQNLSVMVIYQKEYGTYILYIALKLSLLKKKV